MTWQTIVFVENLLLFKLDFIDEQTGYLLANDFSWPGGLFGAVYETTDGGAIWQENFVSGENQHLYTLDMVNSTTGYAMGGCEASGTFVLLKTAAGGGAWNNIVPSNLGVYFSSSAFLTDEIGYAAGHNDNFEGKVVKTVDGGANWEVLSHPLEGNYRIPVLDFIDTNAGWLVAYSDPYYGGSPTYILYTGNGGQAWDIQYMNTDFSFLRDVSIVDQNTGYAVGDNGLMLRKVAINLQVSPGVLDFGEWKFGGAYDEEIELTNTGDEELKIGSVTFEGPDAGDFSVDVETMLLKPQQTESLAVTYSPNMPAFDEATLRISTDFGDALVSLMGYATEPVGIDDGSSVSRETALIGNYPNPFNPETNFAVQISEFRLINLAVYDVQGRLVRRE